MIKGALFDVDDTLYSHKMNAVPKSTIKALKKLREKGIKIGICTSREVGEMHTFPSELLNLVDCQIISTGAVTFVKDQYFKSYTLDPEDVKKYIKYFKENNISYHFSDVNGDCCYAGDKKLVEDGFLMNMCKGHIFYQEYVDEDITNLGFYNVSDSQLEDIRNINPNAYLSLWGHSGHIAPNFVDKGFGLLKFCEVFGFTSDEVLSCGDGTNDDLMIKMGGIGIATNDACENTKKVATYVCKKSIEDGSIYRALVDLKIIEEDKPNIKACFFDNDATVFNHTGIGPDIMPSTITALRKLKEKGIKTCMITSRSYAEMYNMTKDFMDLFDDVMMLSGGYYIENGKVNYTPIDKDVVLKAINLFDELNLTYRYATSDGAGFLNRKDESKEAIFKRLYDMIPPIKKYENEEVLHFIAYTDPSTATKLENEFKDIEYSQATICAEFSAKGIDKGTALEKVVNKYGIHLKDTLVIGDSGNDVSMLEKAGIAVCMGDGKNEAKKIADYVTDASNEDGIYNGLKNFGIIE